MNDQLTSLERLSLEHWAVRRDQIRRKLLLGGTFGWGGMFAFLFGLWVFQTQQFTIKAAIGLLAVSLVAGLAWGWSMWLLVDRRYRQLRKKAEPNGT